MKGKLIVYNANHIESSQRKKGVGRVFHWLGALLAGDAAEPGDAQSRRSISQRIRRKVFAAYLGLAILVTLLQVAFEYRQINDSISTQIETILDSTRPALTGALWFQDSGALQEIMDGMVATDVIVGGVVNDAIDRLSGEYWDEGYGLDGERCKREGCRVARGVELYGNVLSAQRELIGTIQIYTTDAYALAVWLEKLGMVLLGAAIKTIGLWLIFMWAIDRLLVDRLQRASEGTRQSLGSIRRNEGFEPIELNDTNNDELNEIVNGFNELVGELESQSDERRRIEVERAKVDERRRFLANITHELKTPLNGVVGLSELLSLRLKDPEDRELLGGIRQSAEFLTELVGQTLYLSRIESRGIDTTPEPTNVESLARQTARLLSRTFRAEGCELVLDIADDIPEPLMINRLALRQIMTNLLSNAFRHTPKGYVSLTVAASGVGDRRTLEIAIGDTGSGIAPEDQAAIFEPFSHGGSGEQVGGGTGLGLAITNRLVELLGGTIALDSQPGKGSEFRVWLPDLAIGAPLRPVELSASLEGSLSGINVLIVDDSATNRLIVDGYLQRAQANTWAASDGRECLHWVKERPFDLVLMDIMMPDIDGIEASRSIRADADRQDVLIVGLSAVSVPEPPGAQERLFDGFISKPVTREAMILNLVEVLHNRKLPWSERRKLPRIGGVGE